MASSDFNRDKRSPTPKDERVSRVMSANKAKDTKPEIQLRKALWKNGIRGFRLHKKDLPGRPDLAFSRAKLAVFVNGCYWHRCPSCDLPLPKNNQDFWKKKFEANKARDKKKILDLGSAGWKVLVFWECEIKNDLDEVVEKIEQKLNSGFGSKGSST